jgi:hypothetical protein
MKNIYYLFFVSSLLFVGCSTYTIRDYPSKDKFYEDFNHSAGNKDVNITLINDSSFTINDGVVLENDSLFSFALLEERDVRTYPLSLITEIRYTINDTGTALILLKNGETLQAKNIRTGNDSIYFTIQTSTKKNIIVPIPVEIDKVKTISYKTRLRSIPLGMLGGAIVGLLSAVIAGNNVANSKDNNGKVEAYYYGLPILGVVIGGIIAPIIGWKTIYQFNP